MLVLGGVVAVPMGTAVPGRAAGWGAVFGEGPVQDFHDEGLRLYLEAIKRVLEAPGPPQRLEWRNEASGAGGTLLVVGQLQVKDFGECRRV
jgi:surface antigen